MYAHFVSGGCYDWEIPSSTMETAFLTPHCLLYARTQVDKLEDQNRKLKAGSLSESAVELFCILLPIRTYMTYYIAYYANTHAQFYIAYYANTHAQFILHTMPIHMTYYIAYYANTHAQFILHTIPIHMHSTTYMVPHSPSSSKDVRTDFHSLYNSV